MRKAKNIINKKGSVLFIVLLIMTILVVSAAATYYVVASQRASVEVRAAGEQAYQTASSMNNAVSDYIDNYLLALSKSSGKLNSVTNPLVKKMLELGTGGSITTSTTAPSGDPVLAALTSGYGMGEYEVTVKKLTTKIVDGDTTHAFEICSKAIMMEKEVKITQVKTITVGPPEYFSRFFTSTGNGGGDVVLTGQTIKTDIYLENDYTLFAPGNSINLLADLYCSGTLEDQAIDYTTTQPIDIVIANNFLVSGYAGSGFLCGGGNCKVGGDMLLKKTIPASVGANVYVVGDFELGASQSINASNTVYVGGDCTIGSGCSTGGATFYINGDLHLNSNSGQGTFYVTGDVYLGNAWITANVTYCGTLFTNANGYSPSNYTHNAAVVQYWSETDKTTISAEIATSTAKQVYEEWKLNTYFATLAAYTYEGVGEGADTNDPTLLASANEYSGISLPMDVLNADGTSTSRNYLTISSNCVLYPVYTNQGGGSVIEIDATQQDIYITLMPNVGEDTFSFFTGGVANNKVLVRGPYSVIFILPDGVNYKAGDQEFVGHIGWAKVISGNAGSAVGERESSGLIAGRTKDGGVINTITSCISEEGVIDNSLISNADYCNIHNNIFLVSNDNPTLDFTAMESVFWGFIYAPTAVFDITTNNNRSIVGGLIVSDYYFNSTCNLIFTRPFDYYNKSTGGATGYDQDELIKALMQLVAGPTPDASKQTLKSWGTVGYK